MARIRSIKPDAFKSETLSRLDYFTRWTFAGVWTYLDDHGYGRADARLIRAELFPLDDNVTANKVGKAIDDLVTNGSLCRFDVEGRTYIHAPRWTDHQKVNRPAQPKFPACPEHDGGESGAVSTLTHCVNSESTQNPTVGKGTGNREQGTSKSADADAAFEAFWAAYPRRVAKGDAKKAHAKALAKADAATILAGVGKHAPLWAKADPKFIPHAATWLNGERWADDVAPAARRDMRPEGW